MFRSLALVAVLASLTTPLAAQTSYRPRGLLRTGYSDKPLGPGAWEVRASAHDEGGSIPLALYHAAEIASAAGVTELRVVKQKVTSARTILRSSGTTIALTEKTVVTVRAIHTDADRAACGMPLATRCLTLPVAGVLAAYGPRLGMPAARAGETPAAPVVLATARVGDPFAGVPAPAPSGGPFVGLLRALVGQRSAPAAKPAAAGMQPPIFATSAAAPVSGPGTSPPARLPTPVAAARGPSPSEAAEVRYADALRAARPVNADSRLGWRASD